MNEVEEIVEEVPAVAPAPEENPIFNALFKTVEDEPESEEEEEETPRHPTDIMGALAEIEAEEVQPAEEPVATEESPEVSVAPAKKKKRVARKPNVVDPNPRSAARQHIPRPAHKEDPFVQSLSSEEKERHAETSAVNKLAPEIARLERQQKAMQGGPVAQQRFEASKVHFKNAIPKDMQGEFSKNPAAFSEQRPFETKIVNSVLEDAFAMAQSFYNILHEVEDYNEQNASHVGLSKWIDKEQTDFINSGKTKKDGKVFIRRERYPEVSEAEREKYYTFTDDEVIQLLALRVNQNISGKLSHLHKQLSSAGYSRSGASASKAPTVQAPTRTPSPHQPSPRPGPSAQATPIPGKNSILSLLDM